MRKENQQINRYRVRHGALKSDNSYGNNGRFIIPLRGRHAEVVHLTVIASDGLGWDHVSVSLPHRCPEWEEMAYIKDLFWEPNECVVQYHPPADRYVNHHPYALHLWRPQGIEIPVPSLEMV